MGNLGSNIAYFRGQLKMTQKNLGEKLYVSEKTVSHWENERSEPSSEQISSMAQLFGVRLETLHSKLNRSLALAEQKALETYNALSTQRQDDVWFGYGGKAINSQKWRAPH